MMVIPEKRKSNRGLLDFTNFKNKTDTVYSFADAIAVDRPFRDLDEARAAALYLNNVMAFVEFGTMDKDSYSDNCKVEPIFEGIGEIICACRLVSLRVEQYLDLQEEEKR